MDMTSKKFYTWEYHFGSDMQCIAHLFQVSIIIFLAGTIYFLTVVVNEKSTDLTIFGLWYCYVLSAVLYFISGWFFIEFSYPDVAAMQIQRIKNSNYSKKSYFEKYVIDNSLLMSMWFLFLGTIPFLVYPIWAMTVGELSIFLGVLVVLSIIAALYIFFTWVIDSFPENLLENMYQRSTSIYDNLCCCEICCDSCNAACCGRKGCCRFHFGTNAQLLFWILLVASAFALIAMISMILVEPAGAEWYLWFCSTLFFTLGVALLVYASYSATYSTNIAWRFCTCQLSNSNPEPLESGEAGPLLPHTVPQQWDDRSSSAGTDDGQKGGITQNAIYTKEPTSSGVANKKFAFESPNAKGPDRDFKLPSGGHTGGQLDMQVDNLDGASSSPAVEVKRKGAHGTLIATNAFLRSGSSDNLLNVGIHGRGAGEGQLDWSGETSLPSGVRVEEHRSHHSPNCSGWQGGSFEEPPVVRVEEHRSHHLPKGSGWQGGSFEEPPVVRVEEHRPHHLPRGSGWQGGSFEESPVVRVEEHRPHHLPKGSGWQGGSFEEPPFVRAEEHRSHHLPKGSGWQGGSFEEPPVVRVEEHRSHHLPKGSGWQGESFKEPKIDFGATAAVPSAHIHEHGPPHTPPVPHVLNAEHLTLPVPQDFEWNDTASTNSLEFNDAVSTVSSLGAHNVWHEATEDRASTPEVWHETRSDGGDAY